MMDSSCSFLAGKFKLIFCFQSTHPSGATPLSHHFSFLFSSIMGDMNQWRPVDCFSCAFTVPWLLLTQSAFQWIKQWDVPNATGQGQVNNRGHTQAAIAETLHGGCGESAQQETKQPAHRSAQKLHSGVTLTLATASQVIDDIAFSPITFKTSLSKTEWVSIWNSLSTFLLSLSLSLMWLALVLCYRLLLWPVNEW